MTGIVVVSHSRALADAAVALAGEMVHDQDVRMVVAAGLDDTTFGTDAVQILDAVTEADRGDGVVVLMDLGSAVLSAELALDMLDDEVRERTLLCAAPLVEGLVVAAVAAAGSSSPAEVAAEAEAALQAKQAHVGTAPVPPPAEPAPRDDVAEPDGIEGSFTVTNVHGLHARPAARLVRQVAALDARVQLRNATAGSAWVPATSLSKVATLAALQGHEVEVRAAGPQARTCLDELIALAADAFGESGTEPEPAPPARPDHRAGPIGAAPGIGVGPASLPHASGASVDTLDVPDATTDSPATDLARLDDALTAAEREIRRVRDDVAGRADADAAAIFDAHLVLLPDPDLLDDARARIRAGRAAEPAWCAAVLRVAGDLEALADPYLRARAADVHDVGHQVLRALRGETGTGPDLSGVVVAADLAPAEMASLDTDRVVAVVLAFGSPTAHSAILARARGLPVVCGAGPAVLGLDAGTLLAVDGATGELVVDPSPEVLDRFRSRGAALADRRRHALAESASPAVTDDGVHVLVGANVGSPDEARAAAAAGADLAGLVRTEFLFLGRTQAPDVDEQERVYREIAEAFGGRRITLRTLDVGGDKPLPYLPGPVEANPFLGVRGLRLSLAWPQLLADQLLAVVRVAHDVPVSLMFPMVSTLAELFDARRLLDDAVAAVGRGTPRDLQVGMMVEVPAAALRAASFAPHVDFFSVGTNDLTQYALAAERGNHAVAEIGDPLDPAVLQLIDFVCRGADGRALVAVCGELAADEQAAGVLIGLGVRELSVGPAAVPGVKQAVRAVHGEAAVALATRALAADGPDRVRELLTEGA
ncbi:phosphoenolpyruvate--protein phosphotransferase [Pseudonocardia sp. H11422]|uniref:phosphoenolpyruvate--protein phosphotransferase n=1 Tax=Pseudonocardia sp. H11422 TaxID=2835866 RepID=UPI001BDCF89D|nr:phosphoenolpyruvate--protein phosphotransferase [Pseudonocardia sp. H11422]